MTRIYMDKYGFIHTIQDNEFNYKQELDRLYRKSFPDDKESKPNVNEVKRFHKLINDNATTK